MIYSIEDIRDRITPIAIAYGLKAVYLFGSYARGEATSESDVDLLVDSGLRGMAFFGLMDSVASALRIPVDLIDISQLRANSPIEQEIRRSGVRIYEQ